MPIHSERGIHLMPFNVMPLPAVPLQVLQYKHLYVVFITHTHYKRLYLDHNQSIDSELLTLSLRDTVPRKMLYMWMIICLSFQSISLQGDKKYERGK